LTAAQAETAFLFLGLILAIVVYLAVTDVDEARKPVG
jgi:hypothetical protein